jgi:mannose-6-phosphate isomerase-like protein (cupin superfamily)
MRNRMLAAFAAICVVVIAGTVSFGQQASQPTPGTATTAPPVPDLPTGKTMFWSATEIDARWKENETLQRNNSRLFNGPTNISANVRIVVPGAQPTVHETTADLWIVTAGTAVARADGKMVKSGETASIVNGTTRTVRTGDVLYVPPGVPHYFTDMKGFRAWLMRFDTVGLVRTTPAPAAPAAAAGRGTPPPQPEASGQGRGAAQPPPVPDLSTSATMYWTAAEMDARWKENETLKRANSRLYNGPANISANVRIVLDGDPPLTHVGTADLWVVTAGEAVARTDGEIVEANGTRTIRNGMARPVRRGDVLYVPPGVPHHFTDLKGFRAWLIRYDVEGWAQSIKPAAPAGGN